MDVMLCSDIIFNKEQLKRVPSAIRAMLTDRESKVLILMAYRDRTEELSNALYEAFVNKEIDGEQVRYTITALVEWQGVWWEV